MYRRRFFASLNTLAAGMFLGDSAAAMRALKYAAREITPMHVALVSVTNAPSNGIELGIEESSHAALLLNKRIQFSHVISPASAISDTLGELLQREKFSAFVAGGSQDMTTDLALMAQRVNVVFMNTWCTADALRESGCIRNAFHIAPSDRMKREALALSGVPGATECVSWHSSLSRYGADTLNARFKSKFKTAMSEREWNDWFAIKVLWESYLRAGSGDSAALRSALEDDASRFDGHKGKALSFRRWDHQLRQPLYVLTGPKDANIQELPGAVAAEMSTSAALDLLGGAVETRCNWAV